MLDNMSLYADMPGLCKKGWNGFGWSYYSATWKHFEGILFYYLSSVIFMSFDLGNSFWFASVPKCASYQNSFKALVSVFS